MHASVTNLRVRAVIDHHLPMYLRNNTTPLIPPRPLSLIPRDKRVSDIRVVVTRSSGFTLPRPRCQTTPKAPKTPRLLPSPPKDHQTPLLKRLHHPLRHLRQHSLTGDPM